MDRRTLESAVCPAFLSGVFHFAFFDRAVSMPGRAFRGKRTHRKCCFHEIRIYNNPDAVPLRMLLLSLLSWRRSERPRPEEE